MRNVLHALSPRRALALAVTLCAGCGGGSPSSPGGGGTPTPTPSAPRAGLLHGSYTLTVQPAPGCVAPARSFSIAVQAASDLRGHYPGAQVIDAAEPQVELELLDGASVRGALSTTELGAATAEGIRIWIRLVGGGNVSVRSDGSGEVLDGTAGGEMEFGINEDDEGGLGTCETTGGVGWSLRRR
jgi:hypothetical protein